MEEMVSLWFWCVYIRLSWAKIEKPLFDNFDPWPSQVQGPVMKFQAGSRNLFEKDDFDLQEWVILDFLQSRIINSSDMKSYTTKIF